VLNIPDITLSHSELFHSEFRINLQMLAAEIFVLLHEFAHIDAGHLQYAEATEPQVDHGTVISEDFNPDKAMEYEADLLTIKRVRRKAAGHFMLGVWTVLSVCVSRSAPRSFLSYSSICREPLQYAYSKGTNRQSRSRRVSRTNHSLATPATVIDVRAAR
jgi:hypothetical protein